MAKKSLAYEFHPEWDPVSFMNHCVLEVWRRIPYVNEYLREAAKRPPSVEVGDLRQIPNSGVGFLIYTWLFICLLQFMWLAAWGILYVLLPAFRNVRPTHKRWYVVANISKFIMLASHLAAPSWWFYSFLHYQCVLNPALDALGYPVQGECSFNTYTMQTRWTKCISAMYVATDVIALYVVPKLPTSTWIHHVSASMFVAGVFFVSLQKYDIAQKLMMFGFWSTISCGVNLFLALRVLFPHTWVLRPFAWLNALVYSACCAANWGIHILWFGAGLIRGEWSQTNIAINSVYLLLLLSLVQDDLKLISFLFSYKPKPVVDVKKGDDVTPDDANDKGKDKTETADIDSLKKQE